MPQESESLFTLNVSGHSSAVLITDPDGCLVYVSPNVKDVMGVHCDDTLFLNGVLDELRNNGQNERAGREILVTKDQVIVLEGRDGGSLVLVADVHEIALDGCHRLITIRKVDEITKKRKLEETIKLVAESEKYYRTVADHAPISIYVIKEGRFIYINQAWERLTGYSRAESLTLDPFSMIHPSMQGIMWQQKIDQRAGKPVPDRYELIIVNKQKQERWIDLSTIRMTNNGEQTVVSFAIDITDKKKSQEKLKFSHERFNHILKHDPTAIAVFDRNMNYIMVSDRFLQDYGICGKGIIGKNHYEVLPEIPDRWRAVHQRVLSGAVERNEDDWFERLDGTIIYEKWQCRPWYNQNDDIGGMVLYTEVITDRKLVEFALKQSETRMRHLMDSTVEAIVGIDQDGMFTFINRSGIELLGYEKSDEFVGKNMHKLIHHSNPDGSFLPVSDCVHINALQARKSIHNSDVVLWRKDGSSFPASCRLQPIDIDDQPAGGVFTFLNISEQINVNLEKKRLEEQLRHYQKMEAIGTLAGGIAHDFNNILGGIIGYGEMMEIFEMEDRAEMLEKVGRILQAAYRAKDLVNQILAFSRKVSVEFDTVNLIPLIRETLILLRASFPSTITIETSFTAGNDTIYADPTQIHQVLLNLCTNAADSMKKKGGTLAISLSETEGADISDALPGEQLQGAWLLLEIKDTGHGFSSELADRIFDPYFTTKKVGEGIGMGLALVYGIVGVHNGFISAESQSDVGSVFRLFLPQYTPVKEAPGIQTFIAASSGNGRILFVDDEEDLVMINKEMLSKLGYNVTATTSSNEAFDCFAGAPQSFDLVITDETMPGITGTDLALKIHAVRNDIPIILCTGNSTALSQEKAQEAGIMDVLRKPVSFNVLARIVKKILV